MDEYKYFKKQWREERYLGYFWTIVMLVCYGSIFYIAITSSFYWIKNDMLTSIQFSKYFWSNYWYIIPVWFLSIFSRVKARDHLLTCNSFQKKWDKIKYKKEQEEK